MSRDIWLSILHKYRKNLDTWFKQKALIKEHLTPVLVGTDPVRVVYKIKPFVELFNKLQLFGSLSLDRENMVSVRIVCRDVENIFDVASRIRGALHTTNFLQVSDTLDDSSLAISFKARLPTGTDSTFEFAVRLLTRSHFDEIDRVENMAQEKRPVVLSINHKASQAWNVRAEQILTLFESSPPEVTPLPQRERPPDHLHIKGHIDTSDLSSGIQSIGPIISANHFGMTRIAIPHNGSLYTLDESGSRNVQRLAEIISTYQMIKHVATYRFVEKSICDWFYSKIRNETEISLSDWIISKIDEDTMYRIVVVPLTGFRVSTRMVIGKESLLTMITTEDLDTVYSRIPFQTKNESKIMDRMRSAYQGFPAIEVLTYGVSDYCRDFAFHKADKILAILRIYDPRALDAKRAVLIGRKGHVLYREHHSFIRRNQQLDEPTTGLERYDQRLRKLSERDIGYMKRMGFDYAIELMEQDSLKPLQKRLLQSVFMFSKGLTSDDPADRLVHSFSAIEKLFDYKRSRSKNSNSLTKQLSAVLPKLITPDPDEQESYVRAINKAYEIRSRFVHSARLSLPSEIDAVNRAIMAIYTYIVILLRRRAASLEDVKRIIQIETRKPPSP